jgi:putative flippase GtrA
MILFSRFLIVGVANTVLGYAVIFTCMYPVGLSPELSNAAGYAVGLIASYSLNRNFTFQSLQRRSTEFVLFLTVFLSSYTANIFILIFLVRVLAVHPGLSQVLAGIVYIGIAFTLNKRYVFRK